MMGARHAITEAIADRLTVVVRAAGERTEAACIETVTRQCGAAPLIVRERPFWCALRASFAAAVSAGRPYTLCVDADVLLRPGAIADILREMSASGTPCFQYDFVVLDRGFRGPVHAGLHGYPTAYLTRALDFMNTARRAERPESAVCYEMARRGLPRAAPVRVMGLHDFEQFYADLYRKAFVRAAKFNRHAPAIFARLHAEAPTHHEAAAMYAGFLDGLVARRQRTPVQLDVEVYRESASRALADLRLDEKPPLDGADASARAEAAIGAFDPDEWYLANAPWLAPDGYRLT